MAGWSRGGNTKCQSEPVRKKTRERSVRRFALSRKWREQTQKEFEIQDDIFTGTSQIFHLRNLTITVEETDKIGRRAISTQVVAVPTVPR
jgi:hypothetical protein